MVRDYLLLHFVILIWGFTSILGKAMTIPAVELVFYRTLIAMVSLAGVLWWRKEKIAIDPAMLSMILVGMMVGAHWILFFASAQISMVSVCLAGISTSTLWTSLLEPLFMRRRVRFFEIFLGILIILGLYLIFLFEFNHVWGLILSILSALLASIFTILNARLVRHHPPYTISFFQMIGAFAFTLLFLPIYIPTLAKNQTLQMFPTAQDLVLLLILATVCTVYAYSIAVSLMKRISPFAMNLSVNMEPIYGILMAALIFNEHEQMTGGFYAGTAIILASVLIYPLFQHWENRKTAKMLS